MSHKITYRQRGQGPLLILLHGYGGSVTHWDAVSQSLSSEYTVVTLNLSHLYLGTDKLLFAVQVETLAQFILETFPEQKVSVAGLSYGGALAWGLATQYPERISKMVLVNPMVTNPVKHFQLKELRFFFSIPLNLKSIFFMLSTPVGKSFLKKAANIFRQERDEGALGVENLNGRKLQFVAHMIYNFSWILRSEDWNFWHRKLYTYRGDCCIIYDTQDLLFTPEAYRRFAMHIGCEDIVELEGAGHLATKTNPETIAQITTDFLKARRVA